MTRKTPDFRFQEIVSSLKDGIDVFDDHLCSGLARLLKGEKDVPAEVAYAYDLYAEDDHRSSMDAFFLAKASYDVIQEVLEIPVAVCAIYGRLFMDISVFRNKLELMSYAAQYEGDDRTKEMMRSAVTVGVEYLRWMFGTPDPSVGPREIVRKTMTDAFYRGMAHKGNSLISGVTKEAKQWWASTVKYAQVMEELDPRTAKDAIDEFRIVLEKNDSTYTAEAAPVKPVDILH